MVVSGQYGSTDRLLLSMGASGFVLVTHTRVAWMIHLVSASRRIPFDNRGLTEGGRSRSFEQATTPGQLILIITPERERGDTIKIHRKYNYP